MTSIQQDRYRAWIVTDQASSIRGRNAAGLLDEIGIPSEPLTVDWEDPELLRLCEAGAAPRDLSADHGRVAIAVALAHLRTWSRIAGDERLTGRDWGLVVEDDIALHPGIDAARAAGMLPALLDDDSPDEFVYLGVCAPVELRLRRVIDEDGGIETGRGAGYGAHAYAVRKRRAGTLRRELDRFCASRGVAFPAPLHAHLRSFWLEAGGAPLAAINLKCPDPDFPSQRGLLYQDSFRFPSRIEARGEPPPAAASPDRVDAAHTPVRVNGSYSLVDGCRLLIRGKPERLVDMSGSAAIVWKLCEQGASQLQMIDLISERFPEAPSIAEDVVGVLDRFENLGLIRRSPDADHAPAPAVRPGAYLATRPGVRLGRNNRGHVLRDLPARRRWPVDDNAARVWRKCSRPRKPTEIGSTGTVESLVRIGALLQQPGPGTVRVKYMGRLGNHLFVHCFGRILAAELGIDCLAAPLPGFPYTSLGWRGRVVPDRRAELVLGGQYVDINALRERDPPVRRVCLAGHFQRYEYYRPYKEIIRRDWLRFRKNPHVEPDAVVAHVRGGDVWQRHSGWERGSQATMPVSYYCSILDRMRYSRLYIVTERSDDPVVRRLQQIYRCDVVSGEPVHDLRFIASARRIIMSRSTFAWWGAWLSEADEIHFPREGSWEAGPRGISLWVDDEDRYEFHDIDIPSPWRGDDGDIELMLDV